MPRSKSSKQEVTLLLEAIPLTQTEIANHLGVSQGLVSQWKNGHQPIGSDYLEVLRRLARETPRDADDDEQVDSEAQLGSQSYGEWLAEQLEALKVTQAKLAEKAKVNAITISNLITGKTENPQKDTRRKIEDSLKYFHQQKHPREQAPKAPATDPSAPVVGIQFTKDEIDQAPNKCGVYVIHDRRGCPTYVGKGTLRTELNLHFSKKWAAEHAANTFSYAEVDEKDADRIETILIKFMADSLLVNKKKRISVAEPP